MMSITSKYALRALFYLASSERDEFQLVRDISSSLGIPRQYLSKILHDLTERGILQSQRGRNGGFKISDNSNTISLFQVINSLENISHFNECIVYESECDRNTPCVFHELCESFRTSYLACLKKITIEQLNNKNQKLN